MSQVCVLKKCPTVGCNNPSYRNAGKQSKKRFCKPCNISAGMGKTLTWKCAHCDNTITNEKMTVTRCVECRAQQIRDAMKRYRLRLKLR